MEGHHVYSPINWQLSIGYKVSIERDGKPCCREAVHLGGGQGFSQCGNTGKFEELVKGEKMWFCGIHSQAAMDRRAAKQKANDEARRAKSQESHDAWAARQAKIDAYDVLVAALERIRDGHNDPRTLARETIDNL